MQLGGSKNKKQTLPLLLGVALLSALFMGLGAPKPTLYKTSKFGACNASGASATKTCIDVEKLQILQQYPPSFSIGVSLDSEIRLEFSQELPHGSLKSAIHIFSGKSEIRGTLTSESEGRVWIFNPYLDLVPNKVIHIRIDSGLRGRHGATLENDYTSSFQHFSCQETFECGEKSLSCEAGACIPR